MALVEGLSSDRRGKYHVLGDDFISYMHSPQMGAPTPLMLLGIILEEQFSFIFVVSCHVIR
jgi:hypothetical protein